MGWPVAQWSSEQPLARGVIFLPSEELDLVHLGLHFFPLVLLDRSHIDFVVKVTDICRRWPDPSWQPCARGG